MNHSCMVYIRTDVTMMMLKQLVEYINNNIMANYKETKEVKAAAKRIINQMNKLSDNNFDFEYEITDDGIEFISDTWFKYQSEGVKGTKSGKSNEGFKYGKKMPPPSAFKSYTSDKSSQFAIAKSVQTKGIKGKDYAKDFNNDKIINDNIELIYLEFIYQAIDKQLI